MRKILMLILSILVINNLMASDAALQATSGGFLDALTGATGLSLPTLITVAISLLEAILRALPTKKNYSILRIAIGIVEKILGGISTVEKILPNNIKE